MFLIYKITNTINGKYYIGAHKTDNVFDSYIGSGVLIKRAIRKHGKQNFQKEILFVLNSEEEMFEKERELVNEETIRDKNCYNQNTGGTGSTFYLNQHPMRSAWSKKGTEVKKERGIPIRSEAFIERGKHYLFQKGNNNNLAVAARKKLWEEHPEYRQRFIEKCTGSNNNNYGKIWISKNGERKTVSKLDYENNYKHHGWISAKDRVENLPKRWINNTKVNTIVDKSDLDHYLNDGWILGRIKR